MDHRVSVITSRLLRRRGNLMSYECPPLERVSRSDGGG
jgi:hypothetical protein